MGYALITPDDSGQQEHKSVDKYHEIRIDYDYELFDLGRTFDSEDIEKKIVCNLDSKKMIHLKVKNNGYYQFRMYTDEGKNLDGSELTIYLGRSKELTLDTLYCRRYIETTYSNADSFRYELLGDFKTDIEKRIYYSTKCYLQRYGNYYIEYWVNGVDKFNLIIGVCADQFQYDIDNPVGDMIDKNSKNWNSTEKIYGVMLGDTVIAPILSNDDFNHIFSQSDYYYNKIAKGMFCSLIWEVNPNCQKAGPYIDGQYGELIYNYETPLKILHMDQMLGGWLYNKMDLIYNDLKNNKEKQEKVDSFFKGMVESSIAAAGGWVVQKVVAAGAFASASTPASIVAGLVITALFLVADNPKDETFEMFLTKYKKYVDKYSTRNALTTPISLLIGNRHNVINNKDEKFWDIISWNGTTVTAIGGNYHYGKYSYCYTCEAELTSCYDGLYKAMTGELGD